MGNSGRSCWTSGEATEELQLGDPMAPLPIEDALPVRWPGALPKPESEDSTCLPLRLVETEGVEVLGWREVDTRTTYS